jgi:hypothetical protein
MDDAQFPSSTDRAKSGGLLWQMMHHEDNLLATRVSVFLVAESILIAVAAAMTNTGAGLAHTAKSPVRPELFGMTISISLAGLALTLVFWYVLSLNFDNVGALMDELKIDDLGLRVLRKRAERRNARWHFRIIFRGKGMNWVISNVLPLIFLFLWGVTVVFSVLIFFT